MTEPANKELHRIATTAIVYNKEGKFLITKRSLDKKRFPGRWTVPGGGLSTDDYINEPRTDTDGWYFPLTNGLRREIKEEVNIEVEAPEYLRDITFINSDHTPVLVLSYFAKHLSGEVILNNESIEYAWITAEDIPKYDLIGSLADEIKMVSGILEKRRQTA